MCSGSVVFNKYFHDVYEFGAGINSYPAVNLIGPPSDCLLCYMHASDCVLLVNELWYVEDCVY